jgi:hypothetical protein
MAGPEGIIHGNMSSAPFLERDDEIPIGSADERKIYTWFDGNRWRELF